jgi:hypothetical protein
MTSQAVLTPLHLVHELFSGASWDKAPRSVDRPRRARQPAIILDVTLGFRDPYRPLHLGRMA